MSFLVAAIADVDVGDAALGLRLSVERWNGSLVGMHVSAKHQVGALLVENTLHRFLHLYGLLLLLVCLVAVHPVESGEVTELRSRRVMCVGKRELRISEIVSTGGDKRKKDKTTVINGLIGGV